MEIRQEAGSDVAARAPGSFARALLWATGVLLFISFLAVAGREATRDIPTIHLMFWRSLIAFGALLAMIAASGHGLGRAMPTRPLAHLWRASSHFAAQFAWFYALTLIPFAQVFALEFSYPLLMAVLAPLVLGERLTATRLIAAVLGFAGIVVALRPFDLGLSIGTVSALACALGYAFSSMAMKDLTRTETALSILFSMALVQTLLALGPLLWTFQWPLPLTWAWIGAAAISGLLAQYCMARAYALADAVVVAPIDFFRLPLIALVGLLAYSQPLDPWVLAGGGIIIAANLINLMSERRS